MEIILAVATIVGTAVGIIALLHQLRIGELKKVNRAWAESRSNSQLSVTAYPYLSKRYRLRTALRKVIMSHISYSEEKFDAGTYENAGVMVQYYLDLMEASVDPSDLKVLAKNLAWFVEEMITYDYDIIAVPKNGNPLLGYATSCLLKKKLLVVKTHAPRRSHPFDGTFIKGQRVVLIDDVSSEGTFLTKPILTLRSYDLEVTDCLVLVHRKEGTAHQRLRNVDVSLHALCEFSDQDLTQLCGISKI